MAEVSPADRPRFRGHGFLARIDRYVLAEVFGPFMGGLVFFLFVFLMFQVLRLAEFFIVHGVSGWRLGKMASLYCLNFMPTALPVAFLLAVLVAFGRLSADNELSALKAGGVSILRLAVPLTALSAAVVTISLFLNMEWVPWGERELKSLIVKTGNTKAVSSIKEGTFTSGFFDLLIFADKVDPKTNRLSKVFIYDERNAKSPFTVVAKSGEVLQVKTQSEFASSALLRLYNGSIHQNNLEANTYSKIDFKEYNLYLRIDEGAANSVMKPQMIPYHALEKAIQGTSVHSFEGAELRGEYWRRVAIAFSPMIFVFLGIGFGTVRTRTVRAGAALVAFVILLAYWSILALATVWTQKGTLPPIVAMQLPNLACFAAAIYSFRRAYG